MTIDREQAVRILSEATKGRVRLSELPVSCRPSSTAEALAIQDLLVARLSGEIAGWKVGLDPSGIALWGAIFAADCFDSPARISDANQWKPLGIEGEIAFRFERDLPCRIDPYTRSEIEEVLVAFPAMEIVSSRFTDYRLAPFLDRVADRVSNGGMVIGTPRPDWRSFDLAHLRVTLDIDGSEKLNQIGGHPKLDPLLPAVDFIRARQAEKTFRAGQFMTTGTFTGLIFGKPGQCITVNFQSFGTVKLTIG
ncbi:hydratase [Betaproteobacteria bacterium]|nr:hydratase [Betaproteobacteria bacterium]